MPEDESADSPINTWHAKLVGGGVDDVNETAEIVLGRTVNIRRELQTQPPLAKKAPCL